MSALVVWAQRRFTTRRRNESRRWRMWLLVAVVVVVALAVTGFFVASSSLFALRYVTVEGTSRLTPAQVLSAAGVREGSSLVGLDPGAVAHRVERLAPVADAQVSRNWPHGLVIHVIERRPAGVVVTEGNVELLDATGVAFASAPSAPHGLVAVEVAQPVPGPGEAQARTAMQVLGQLPTGVRAKVDRVTARSVNAVSVHLTDGRTVVWGSASEGATKAAVLRTLMRRHAQVYDVSTPSVAVTRG